MEVRHPARTFHTVPVSERDNAQPVSSFEKSVTLYRRKDLLSPEV
jgi:hypothetical protein